MRRQLLVCLAAALCVSGTARSASAQYRAQESDRSIQGFGGVTFGTSSVFGTSASSTFGGQIAAGLTPNLQVIGEGGRMSDIKPPFFDVLEYTPTDLHVRAWYAEGGVRFIASPDSAVRPYGEATAGFARLNTDLSGVQGLLGTAVDTGLEFLNRTEPMLGVGGGVVLQTGPLSIDVGYRYTKILVSRVESVLNGGNPYQVNQIRFGVGFRF
jgi:opacity protein-like surface antigen